MNIATLLPFILIIGVMLLMTRSAKNKQRQAAQMRDQMQPGSGVRTIGGIIALVKEVRDTTVLLEVAPGVHSIFAKNAIGAVLSEEEYDRLVNNDVPLAFEDAPAEDATEDHADAADAKVDLGKTEAAGPDDADAAPHGTGADDAENVTDVKDSEKK
ncbi:preprotein translocase subunit YajC [Streptomyces sp. ICBB 8177]|uniref:preprotein translocase subunit YajC n=1 Tax=Streptomyces sp. ICBB 8177 TaxID=563922 RepID=UPI000D679666|nr:preprotein translocase subunit YajC [Streptomyces sp. ICBB 8177]PWI42075.1 preprotein translocase subunit YajC [Streptomyces sp. ICBB 8177]